MEDVTQELALSTQSSKNKKTTKQKNPNQTKVKSERDRPKPAGDISCCAGVSKAAPAHLSSPCFCETYLLVSLRSDNSASFFTQHKRGRVSRQHWRCLHPRPVSSYRHFCTPGSPELSPGAYRSGPSHEAIPTLRQL